MIQIALFLERTTCVSVFEALSLMIAFAMLVLKLYDDKNQKKITIF